METFHIPKIYIIYALHCKTTDQYYIGSTSNLSNRLNTHLSTFKSGTSTCYSRIIFEKNNYELLILKNNIVNKTDCKQYEWNFINAYGTSCVNHNKPVLCDLVEYKRNYYLKRKKIKKSNTCEIMT